MRKNFTRAAAVVAFLLALWNVGALAVDFSNNEFWGILVADAVLAVASLLFGLQFLKIATRDDTD